MKLYLYQGEGNRGQGTTTKVDIRETKQRRKKNHVDENKGQRKHLKSNANFEFRWRYFQP